MEDYLEPLSNSSRGSVGDPDGMVTVVLPSGAPFPVHPQEAEYLISLVRRYQDDLKFNIIGDLQDLDRLLMVELMCFRWGVWLSRGCDYDVRAIDSDALEKSLAKFSSEARQIKNQLDMTKKARDASKGVDSVSAYINNLLARAKEFGVHRSAQSAKAIELAMELKSMVGLHMRCDDIERAELHMELEDVLEWIVTVFVPEFDRLDEDFRTRPDGQRYWVRSL